MLTYINYTNSDSVDIMWLELLLLHIIQNTITYWQFDIYHVRFEYDHNTMFYSEMQNDIKYVQINCNLEPNLMHFN